MWFQSDKGSQSYIGVTIAFSFFLLIYLRCGAPASWAARHTIVCLDILLSSIGIGINGETRKLPIDLHLLIYLLGHITMTK